MAVAGIGLVHDASHDVCLPGIHREARRDVIGCAGTAALGILGSHATRDAFLLRSVFRSAWRDVRAGRISMELPVAFGVAITFAVSTAATFDPNGSWGQEVYFDSLTMFVFFLLTGRWLEAKLKTRTAGALDALLHRLPDSVERLSGDERWQRVSPRRLVVGDIVRVWPGEAFPADGLLVGGDTSADEALLSGESRPVPRGRGDRVLAGSHNISAPVKMRVERVGAETRFANIVRLMERAALEKPRLARLADRFAYPFLWGYWCQPLSLPRCGGPMVQARH